MKKYWHIIALCFLQCCSEQSSFQATPKNQPATAQPQPSEPKPPPIAVKEVDKCKQLEKQMHKKTHVIKFPDSTKEYDRCGWNNGNFKKSQNHFTAYFEEKAQIKIDTDKKLLCKIAISTTSSDFKYDDHMLFSVNNYILFASYGRLNKLLSKEDSDISKWDWNLIEGELINPSAKTTDDSDNNIITDSSTTPYCLGGNETCNIPATDKQSQLSFSPTFDSLKPLTEKLIADSNSDLTFSLIVLGDNDPATDCTHTDVDFTIDLYLVPKG